MGRGSKALNGRWFRQPPRMNQAARRSPSDRRAFSFFATRARNFTPADHGIYRSLESESGATAVYSDPVRRQRSGPRSAGASSWAPRGRAPSARWRWRRRRAGARAPASGSPRAARWPSGSPPARCTHTAGSSSIGGSGISSRVSPCATAPTCAARSPNTVPCTVVRNTGGWAGGKRRDHRHLGRGRSAARPAMYHFAHSGSSLSQAV